MKITVGRLLCGELRNMLEESKFLGHPVEWHEGRGLIERDWIIRGSPDVLHRVNTWVERNL
jgi:hypothetical protein